VDQFLATANGREFTRIDLGRKLRNRNLPQIMLTEADRPLCIRIIRYPLEKTASIRVHSRPFAV
jgi:hypothetical protein